MHVVQAVVGVLVMSVGIWALLGEPRGNGTTRSVTDRATRPATGPVAGPTTWVVRLVGAVGVVLGVVIVAGALR